MFRNYVPQSDYSKYYFFDDFGGGNFDNRTWEYGGTAGGSIAKLAALAGQISVTVAATADSEYYIVQATKCNYDAAYFIDIALRIKIPNITFLATQIGFETNSTHYIHIRSDSDTSTYWVCRAQNGGSATQVISSLLVDTNWHILRIIGTNTSMDFFVDSTLIATISTNLPTVPVGPIVYVYRYTGGSGTRSVLVDWIEAVGTRA